MKSFKDSPETNMIGEKVSKASERIEACGAIDELQSIAGLARAETKDEEIRAILKGIQEDLFAAGAAIADPDGKLGVAITADHVKRLEDIIAKAEKELEPLDHFILTGGSREAALLDVCRTAARRAERSIVRLMEKEKINAEVFRYINRLSDVFFALSRLANKRAGIAEEKWIPRK